MRTILAPVDFSPGTKDVVAAAASEAGETGGVILLMHVCQRSEALSAFDAERAQLSELAEPLRESGLEVLTKVVHGDPAEEILGEAVRLAADLIVVGSHGHSAVYDVIVGGVAETLLRRSRWPVLIVPVHQAREEQQAGSVA